MEKQELDLILLDIMLPGIDGKEVCRCIRKFSSIPVITATGRLGLSSWYAHNKA